MPEDINEYLDAIERDKHYVVDAVLKESPSETTERVYYTQPDGTRTGPYVFKRIDKDTGLGLVYERIFEAQKEPREFTYIPHIVDYYEIDDKRIVVMDYIEGETLAEIVYQRDPSPELAQEIFPQLCDAVSELHENFEPPIIHRDLKPSNIMIAEGRPMLIDFGIARTFKEGSDTDTLHFGTRAYAPPEQFGFGQTDVRSDVYALGMLLYFCLTEENPDQAARDAHFRKEGIPEAISDVIARAAELDPSARYGSVRELKEAYLAACERGGEEPSNPESARTGNTPFDISYTSEGSSAVKVEASHVQEIPIAKDNAAAPVDESAAAQTPAPTPAQSPSPAPTQTAPSVDPVISKKPPREHHARTHKTRTPRNALGRAFSHIPFGVGVAWDIILAIILLGFLITCLMFIFAPDTERYPNTADLTLLTRILRYGGTFILLAAIGYAVCDRRPLISMAPRLANVSTLREIIICIIVAVVMIVLISIS